MLVVSSNGDIKTVCYHPHAVLQDNSALCPDCEQTFSKRSKAYKEIASREPSQKRTPTRSPIGVGSGDSWNNSPEGLNFWERVGLVWPYLTQEERHHAYFTQGVDYPRSLEMLEAAELRRQITLPLEPVNEKAIPYDANGHELKIGDIVTAAWEAGRDIYFGVIEFISGQRRIKAYGLWIEGRRKGDSNSFAVETTSLIKVVPPLEPIAQKPEARTGGISEEYRHFTIRAFCYTDQWDAYVYSCPDRSKHDDTLVATSDDCDNCFESAKQWIDEFWASNEPSEFADLEAERDRLIKDAEFAPENGWIETGKVSGKDFRQAWWRGNFPNGKKTIYIGREGGSEYGKAKNAQQARKRLKKVLRQIEQLKKGEAHAVS